MLNKRLRVLIVANQDWFFLSHRLPLAHAIRTAGAEVVVVAGDSGKASAIREEGFEFVAMPISRKGVNPVRELHTLRFLRRTYRRLQPDLVHHVTIKPVLYGSIASQLVGGMAVVNAISGLGYVFASRMLWDKGVKEFVEAARLIRAEDESPRFVLAGTPDFGNPGAIAVTQMQAWSSEGAVEWWGQRNDMPAVLAQSSVVVLPTMYGEGVPKILLEAAAAGRPIVATDVRGCREIVRPGINGMLVAPGNGTELANAIRVLLESRDLRERFGRAGREIAVAEFAEETVVRRTLDVYRDLLGAS